MNVRHLGGVLVCVALALAAAGCGGTSSTAAPATPSTPVPTYLAPSPTTRPTLTSHELQACAKWAEMNDGKHHESLTAMVVHAQSVAMEAWVDAEGGRIHQLAKEAADGLVNGGEFDMRFVGAGARLTEACGIRARP